MLSELVAALPYYVMGIGSSLTVLLRSCSLKISCWKFLAIMWGKTIIVNILILAVIKHYYGNTMAFKILEINTSLIWFFLLIVLLYWAFQESITKSILIFWIGDGVSLVVTSVVGWLSSLLIRGQGIRPENTLGYHTFFAAVIGVAWIFFFTKSLKPFFAALRRLEIKHEWIIWLFFLTYCVACVIISINTSLRAGTGLVQSNIITAILFIMLIVGSLVYLKREQLHLKRENQNLIMQKKQVEAYNDVLMEQMILTRKLRHDIKNHLRTIEELNRQNAGNEAIYAVISEYTEALDGQYEALKPTVYCSDLLANSVIVTKVSQCRKENIQVLIDIHSLEYGDIPDYEMTSILFNLFDNAIESCRKINEKKDRFIRLTCDNKNSWLMLEMENSMGEAISPHNGHPATTKKDRKMHGLGISIIKDIVERHHGSFQYQASNGRFTVRIAMEINEEKKVSGNENRDL